MCDRLDETVRDLRAKGVEVLGEAIGLTLSDWSFQTGHMMITATEFKAKCLSLIDRAHRLGETITITKRGRVVAKLVGDRGVEDRPWMALRGSVVRYDGPLSPAIAPYEIDAYR